MDDLVYVAMTGLRQAEKLQTVISHNIANASTIGFRAEVPIFTSEEILGDGLETRVNTLEVGADNLILADTNEEGANLLALQTRQSLSSTALSLAAQSDQNVLQLF